ncbi:MAG: hypothetical protein FWE31_02455 [Firmicutes bacterium]|nr:hypothetical protein [Bacillota bacterium]
MLKGNEMLVPALLGLGLYANNTEMNLANNTSILLMLFLLLKGQGEEHHSEDHIGLRGGRGGHSSVRAVRTIYGDIVYVPDYNYPTTLPSYPSYPSSPGFNPCNPCNPCCNPCAAIDGRGRFGRTDGFGCACCCDPCGHHHHERRRHDEHREEKRRRHREIEEKLERIERCACHRHHHRERDLI